MTDECGSCIRWSCGATAAGAASAGDSSKRSKRRRVRAVMQVATGMHHIERGQARAAVERLEEGIAAIDRITNDHGVDVIALRAAVARAVAQLRARERVTRVSVRVR